MKKEAWEFFKLNFKWILGFIFLLIIWSNGVFKRKDGELRIVHSDTTIIIHDGIVGPYKPSPINVLPANPIVIQQPQYQPDTSSIQALRKQFNDLVAKHTERKIYNDTLKIDTLGYVNVKDTIAENELLKRSYSYKIRERQITTTITEREKQRNQVYAGFSLENYKTGQRTFTPTTLSLDLSLINKRNTMLTISGLYDFMQGQPGVSIGINKLISFRK